MNMTSLKSWFLSQTDAERIVFIMKLMHELTVNFRYFTTLSDTALLLIAASKFNELNHRLTAYTLAILKQSPHYPDEIIFDMIEGTLTDPKLQPYVQHTVQEVTKFAAAQGMSR